jgi:hypothetical protein
VPEFCTCGAQLPEDARFCHKCGKPQREEDAVAEQRQTEAIVAAVTAPPPPLPEAAPVTLRDRVTVSTALMAAGVTLLLSVILGQTLGALAPVAGGLFAVYVYRKRTGRLLTIMNAIRLGWIAGIIVFTLTTVFIAVVAAALTNPEIAQQLREQMAKSTASREEVTKILEMMQSFSGVLLLLLGVFVSSTLLMGLGGAVGALFVRRGTADHPRT